MFPPRSIQRLGIALLEIAEAALQPLPTDGGASIDHPHRRPARIERTRRPGTIEAREHVCVSPLPSRTAMSPTRVTS